MERVMAEVAHYFCGKKELDVHLILYGIKRDIFYPLPANIIVHKPSFRFNDRFRLISTLRTIAFLRKKISGLAPQAVLSFGEYWNNFVLLAMYGLNIPVFVSDRSQPDKSLGKFHDRLRNWLYPRAKGVIAQTEKARQIYEKWYRHPNIRVIGNPVRSIPARPDVVKENLVLMVGRLIKSKNQDKLIEMFARINMPDWKLVLVGYDHLKQQNMSRLQALARELNIEDRVVFAGKQADVESYYLKSSIFAFTSSSEGFPNVIGEAMSAGLPVISFDCVAGPSDLITDGHDGLLIPLFDCEMFRVKLEKLMTDASLRERLGMNARESIKRFSIDGIGERFFQFIMQHNTTVAEEPALIPQDTDANQVNR